MKILDSTGLTRLIAKIKSAFIPNTGAVGGGNTPVYFDGTALKECDGAGIKEQSLVTSGFEGYITFANRLTIQWNTFYIDPITEGVTEYVSGSIVYPKAFTKFYSVAISTSSANAVSISERSRTGFSYHGICGNNVSYIAIGTV